jgi:PAS domain S-box-containing protein
MGKDSQLATDFLDMVADAVFLRDLTGVIAYWNRGAESVYGWAAGEAEGQCSHELLHTEFPRSRAVVEDEVLESGAWRGTLWQRRRDGTRILVESRWSLRRDARGQPSGMLEINTDITARHDAEVRQQLRLAVGELLATAPDWLAVEQALPRIVGEKAGATTAELWDVSRGEEPAPGRLAWVAEASGAPPAPSPVGALRRGEGVAGRAWASGQVEAAAEPPGATLALPVLAAGRVERLFVWRVPEPPPPSWRPTLRDIGLQLDLFNQRAHSEEALRQSEVRFRSLLDCAPDPIVIVDGGGAIVYVNRRVEEVLGYSAGELDGQPIERLLPERFRGAHVTLRRGYTRAPKTRPMGAGLELFARHKGGAEVPVEISLSPLQLGGSLLVTAVMRDISDRRHAEAEARRAHTLELARTEHLATLGEVAAGLAHEIKNPLAGMASALEVLSSRFAEPERAIMAEVRQQITRIGGIVADLLNYARPRPPRFALGDLNAAVRHAAEIATRAAVPKHVHLEFAPGTLPPVVHDAEQVQRMVLNLALNALDAVAEDGQIAIVTEPGGDGHVRIRVRDNGPGIAAGDLQNIFRPFYTTKGGKGNGLGLPMCRRIAELHGGSIEVTTQLGQGTTFSIVLPAAGGEVPAAAEGGSR